ncbi:MAG: hypothetical protein E7575_02970 [Ruminococcaceae bacterium]|nr:hypothetical protein [Oscillospiraceae bacterium]
MAEKTIEQLTKELEKAKAEAKAANAEADEAKAQAAELEKILSEKESQQGESAASSDYFNEKVKYTPPIVPGVLENDLIVIHKGVPYQLPRGKEAEIPRKVLNTIRRSDNQKLKAVKYAREQKEIYLKAEKALS